MKTPIKTPMKTSPSTMTEAITEAITEAMTEAITGAYARGYAAGVADASLGFNAVIARTAPRLEEQRGITIYDENDEYQWVTFR